LLLTFKAASRYAAIKQSAPVMSDGITSSAKTTEGPCIPLLARWGEVVLRETLNQMLIALRG